MFFFTRESKTPLSAARYLLLAACFAFCASHESPAQATVKTKHRTTNIALDYVSLRSLRAAAGQNFWMQGVSFEASRVYWHGLGVATNVTGAHSGSIGSSGVPLSFVTITGGPHCEWQLKPAWTLYGDALFGGALGFDSLFPSAPPTPVRTSAGSFAMQLGGGVDYRINHRFAARALDIGWVRTQLPNSTDDIQNTLRLGAGIIARF